MKQILRSRQALAICAVVILCVTVWLLWRSTQVQTYEDCVLRHMGPGMGDRAASLVQQACRLKFSERQLSGATTLLPIRPTVVPTPRLAEPSREVTPIIPESEARRAAPRTRQLPLVAELPDTAVYCAVTPTYGGGTGTVKWRDRYGVTHYSRGDVCPEIGKTTN